MASICAQAAASALRPALLLLSAKLLDYPASGAVKLGAVVEIIHTATLVHDDIIDEAQTRRGRPAANTQWGNAKCVLAGDWLYMQAFKIGAARAQLPHSRRADRTDAADGRGRAAADGKARQVDHAGRASRSDLSQDACLFSVCMRLGAILGGERLRSRKNAWREYGRNLGMAFQIVDDVLDLTASEEVLGKPVASDLREGKATMAVIHAMERCTPEERTKIEIILRDRAFNGVSHTEILDILNRYGSLDYAMNQAAQYAEAARKAICTFPDSETKRALLWAPDFVVAREK